MLLLWGIALPREANLTTSNTGVRIRNIAFMAGGLAVLAL
jgi:hypothetical protein